MWQILERRESSPETVQAAQDDGEKEICLETVTICRRIYTDLAWIPDLGLSPIHALVLSFGVKILTCMQPGARYNVTTRHTLLSAGPSFGWPLYCFWDLALIRQGAVVAFGFVSMLSLSRLMVLFSGSLCWNWQACCRYRMSWKLNFKAGAVLRLIDEIPVVSS